MVELGLLGGDFDNYDDKLNVANTIGTHVINPDAPMSEWINNLNNSDGTPISSVVGGLPDLGQEILNVKRKMINNINSKGVSVGMNYTMYQLAENINNIPTYVRGNLNVKMIKSGVTTINYNLPFKPKYILLRLDSLGCYSAGYSGKNTNTWISNMYTTIVNQNTINATITVSDVTSTSCKVTNDRTQYTDDPNIVEYIALA